MNRTIAEAVRAVAVVAVTILATACTLQDAGEPGLLGPSEFALSVTMSASPDQLPRDGVSQSVVTVTVRNDAGAPIAGQRLSLTMPTNAPSGARLSATEVVTNSSGIATFT